MDSVLVTGCSGFIGFHLSMRLLKEGFEVYGIDNMNSYYDVALKQDRLKVLNKDYNFKFKNLDLKEFEKLNDFFLNNDFSFIFHFAAQAGVRYSYDNPQAYIDSNIKGFFNLFELSKIHNRKKIFYASSSSIYGDSNNDLSTEIDKIEPISFYGFTKYFNENYAKNFNHLFDVNSIGLRFFTVYGPWGRPDMAYYKFVRRILKNEIIDVYNYGNHSRSFTYIDDVVESIFRLYNFYKQKSNFLDVFNIGGGENVKLKDFIETLEILCNKKAIKNLTQKMAGDVKNTKADCSKIFNIIKFKPNTNINRGLKNFYDWFIKYHD